MSKAATLLKTAQEPRKVSKTADKSVTLDPQTLVNVPTYDRKASVRAVARLLKRKAAVLKSLETETEALKATLRAAGQDLLDVNAEAGNYYSNALVGGVKIARANKFSPVPYGRDDLAEAIGAENYRIMFDESAMIAFSDIDSMRRHVTMCNEAGVAVEGTPTEKVTPNSKVVEYICRVGREIDNDRKELLRVCAREQTARVLMK
jgi:hypothetical protein